MANKKPETDPTRIATKEASVQCGFSITHFHRVAGELGLVPKRSKGGTELQWSPEQVEQIKGRKKR